MVNLESQRKLVEEYELLGRIIDADITFENSKDRTSGTCYLKCNTVFKVLNINVILYFNFIILFKSF